MKFKFDLSKLKNLRVSGKSKKSAKKMPGYLQKLKIKPQKSSSLSLSKKDFVLLTLLIIGFQGYGLYHFFLNPKWQEFSSLQTRYTAEQMIAANFEKDMAQKDHYLENLKLQDYKFNALTKVLPSEVPQEEIVLMLNKLSKERELEINGISLSDISFVSKQDFSAGKTILSQSQDNSKTSTTTNVAADSQNSQSTSANMSGSSVPAKANDMVIVENIDIAFSGNYGSLYNFISDLEQSVRKIIIQEVSMTRAGGDLLKGQLKIQYIGYVSPDDKNTYTLDTPETSGKDSPFQAYAGFEENISAVTGSSSGQGQAPVKTSNPDFYLMLSTYDDNAPKIIMGDYTKNGTEVYSNANANVRGKLAVSGDEDNMTYSYSLDGAIQTKQGKLLIDGGKIHTEVIAHARKNEQDKVGLILDVDNKTNYPLEITVISDDKQAPRFSLGTQFGSVTLK
ncbi:hypothetical protein [Desulfosporosinus meridiei]|uniref:Tfp pilus assembly protein PilO n=1 Tax=Desulfosporosinus meridiei (strain ATCC BAA-275 / DSM 13257 / KCTC 12902 / NCIMB 13706 / S10) TaxID=768704 RepID=J7IMH9_DESMD|nr:hypothetical protein [Desulfosporosinus meridiei]AFQ43007.1 hypothetical protein Desmer_0983 [Desulfosporosinus meridiei DSM 13257]